MDTQSIKIQGADFEIPARYVEGAVLTANEASAMNQLFAENVRNNSASKIKAAREAFVEAGGDENDFSISDELRSEISNYANSYEFGARTARAAKEPVDPVAREAYRIAKDAVAEALRGQGIKQKDLPEGRFDELVTTYAQDEGVIAEANRRVKATAKIGLGNLDLGALAPAEATDAAA